MSRLPKAPRWKRSIEAAYDFLIENEERTLPLDLHKSLKSRGYIVRTYSHIAEKSNVSLADVCEALGSKDGTAKYRDRRDKHIICYNDTIKPRGRIIMDDCTRAWTYRIGTSEGLPRNRNKAPCP